MTKKQGTSGKQNESEQPATAKKGAKVPVQVTTKSIVMLDSEPEAAANIPEAAVKVLNDEGLSIRFEKLRNALLVDQGRATALSDGCYSNPGGPGC